MHSPSITTPHHPAARLHRSPPSVASFISLSHSPSHVCRTFQAPYFHPHLWLHILLSIVPLCRAFHALNQSPPPPPPTSPSSSFHLSVAAVRCKSSRAVARETAAHAKLTASFMPFCSVIKSKDPPLSFIYTHTAKCGTAALREQEVGRTDRQIDRQTCCLSVFFLQFTIFHPAWYQNRRAPLHHFQIQD